MAILTKEHAATLPFLLLLTDYFWNPGFSLVGARRNWRLYTLMGTAATIGVLFIASYLAGDNSAGFNVKEFTWYQYFFTECRAFFVYLGLLVWPAQQSIDYAYPISRTLWDRGAILALLGLAGLIFVAFRYRRRYPLAAYGFFAALLLLAPTSSIVPLKDALTERRLYLPMIGFLLIALEFVRRVPVSRSWMTAALSLVCLTAFAASYRRNEVWNDELVLWQDAAQHRPLDARAHYGIANTLFKRGQCAAAVDAYKNAESLSNKPDYRMLMNFGRALNCARQSDQALTKFQQALAIRPTVEAFMESGIIEAANGRTEQAFSDFNQAERINPNLPAVHVSRGDLFWALGQSAEALRDFQRALALDPSNAAAKQGLARLQSP